MVSWFDGLRDEQVALSAVTLLELQEGIERTRRQDGGESGLLIEAWVNEVENTSYIQPMDGRCFSEASRMMVGRKEELYYYVMIAATARMNGLTVATRN